VLAHPISRLRLALARFGAIGVEIGVICTGLWLGLLALSGPVGFTGVTAGELLAASAQLALFGLCFAALAFALGAATGSRSLTVWASAGVAVLAYLANGILPQVAGLAWTRNVSPFYWYLGGDPLANGLQAGGPLVLLGVAAALVATGTAAFTRRDIAV
jgi:ABC-2 type transport system permease protein